MRKSKKNLPRIPRTPRQAFARLRKMLRDKVEYLGRDKLNRRVFRHTKSTFKVALGGI
jgi:hypothetical protein